jgi:hypothetical protein
MSIRWGRYRKFIVALLGAAAVIAAELPPDAPSWLTGTFAVLSAFAVLAVRNDRAPTSRVELAEQVPPPTRAAKPEERPRHRLPYDTP